jgi:hypothetical protein
MEEQGKTKLKHIGVLQPLNNRMDKGGLVPTRYGVFANQVRGCSQAGTEGVPSNYGTAANEVRRIWQRSTGNLPRKYGGPVHKVRGSA